jgi:hypothetical protein
MCVGTLDVFARYAAKNKGLIVLSTLKVDAMGRRRRRAHVRLACGCEHRRLELGAFASGGSRS